MHVSCLFLFLDIGFKTVLEERIHIVYAYALHAHTIIHFETVLNSFLIFLSYFFLRERHCVQELQTTKYDSLTLLNE